jgi:hypothetical protein
VCVFVCVCVCARARVCACACVPVCGARVCKRVSALATKTKSRWEDHWLVICMQRIRIALKQTHTYVVGHRLQIHMFTMHDALQGLVAVRSQCSAVQCGAAVP